MVSRIANYPAFSVRERIVSDSPMANFAGTTASDLLTVKAWQIFCEKQPSPWLLPESVAKCLGETRGWKAYQFDLSDDKPIRVTVQNLSAVYTVTVGLVALTFALGIWKSWARNRWWMLFCSATLSMALLLPIGIAPFASGMFIGACLGAMWMARRRVAFPIPEVATTYRDSTSQFHPVPVTLAVLMLSCSWFMSQAWSQEVSKATPAVSGDTKSVQSPSPMMRVAKVLVPMDRSGQQTGNKLYVPEAYYQHLLEQAARVRSLPKGWLIRRANYRADLRRETKQQENLFEIRASFDVQVFQRDTVVTSADQRRNPTNGTRQPSNRWPKHATEWHRIG